MERRAWRVKLGGHESVFPFRNPINMNLFCSSNNDCPNLQQAFRLTTVLTVYSTISP